MYLSAERLALANQTVLETFERTCVTWQSIPHWDTGDPGQTFIQNDLTNAPAIPGVEPPLGVEILSITPQGVQFAMSLAQAIAPTPDALLAAVIARTAHLAKLVDDDFITKLEAKVPLVDIDPAKDAEHILAGLVVARIAVEDAGYLAPSCLFADNAGYTTLSGLIDGVPATEYLSPVPKIYSLYRFEKLNDTAATPPHQRLYLLGRRQRIAHGGAATASAGEEPVDLAVSVPPSLEVVGDDGAGNIRCALRIRYAVRIKDASGLVAVAVP